jgi:organic hydroperoxide reductase OsmC/OhrA
MLSSKHSSRATWSGSVPRGSGEFMLGKADLPLPFSFKSRMGMNTATNPEELIAAALSGRYAMSTSGELESNGTPADLVTATATPSSCRRNDHSRPGRPRNPGWCHSRRDREPNHQRLQDSGRQ